MFMEDSLKKLFFRAATNRVLSSGLSGVLRYISKVLVPNPILTWQSSLIASWSDLGSITPKSPRPHGALPLAKRCWRIETTVGTCAHFNSVGVDMAPC